MADTVNLTVNQSITSLNYTVSSPTPNVVFTVPSAVPVNLTLAPSGAIVNTAGLIGTDYTTHSHTDGGVTDHGLLGGLGDNDHPQYMLSSVTLIGTGVTTASVTGSELHGTLDSLGINLGVPKWITTATGGGGVGLNTAGTNITWTVNSSGISINNPAWLTTAMQSASSSVFAKTGLTTATITGTELKGTLNTNGLNLEVPAWLTNATATGGTGVGLNTAGTNITWTVNSSGISINNPSWLTTAALSNHTHSDLYQSTGAYLTTARVSNDGVGLNTAGTNITWTVNSSGISINNPAWLTTAAQSGHSHGNPTLALTNVSGTTASASNGLTLSLSVAAPGGAGVGLNTAGTNITWTVNSSGISINNPAWITTAAQSNHSHGNPTLALTNLSGTTASASNGLTLSISAGNYLTTAAASNHTHGNISTASTAGANLANTSASNGLTLGVPVWLTTAAVSNHTHSDLYQSTGAYLTTAMVSNAGSNFVGLNTGLTNLTGTINSSGISLSAPALGYIFFSNTNGHTFCTSTNGVSTSVWIVT